VADIFNKTISNSYVTDLGKQKPHQQSMAALSAPVQLGEPAREEGMGV
jgi:hypothetical protein